MQSQPMLNVTARVCARMPAQASLPTPVAALRFCLGTVSLAVVWLWLCMSPPLADAQRAPRLTAVRPSQAMAKETISLRGRYLDTVTEAKLGDAPLALGEASSTSLSVTLPEQASTGTLSVTSEAGTASLRRPLVIFALPEVERVEPKAIFAGDQVTLHGRNLGEKRARYRFGRTGLRVMERADDHIVVRMPASTREGQFNVVLYGRNQALGEALAPHAVPKITAVARAAAAPGSLTVSGRDLQGVERFTLGETALKVLSGDEARGRKRVLELPAMTPGSYELAAHAQGRVFPYRRTITIEQAPQVSAVRYEVEKRDLLVTVTGTGLDGARSVRMGKLAGRIAARSADRLQFRVRSQAPKSETAVTVRTRLATSDAFAIPPATDGYSVDVATARTRLTKADKSYAPAQIRLDVEQLRAVLAQGAGTAAGQKQVDAAGPEAVRTQTLTAVQGITRLGAMQNALCAQMKTGKAAAAKNAALGTLLAEVSGQQIELIEKVLSPLWQSVSPAQLGANPAAFGLVEADRELATVVGAQAKIAGSCKNRRYGEGQVGLADQTANVELERRVKQLFTAALTPAVEAEPLEKRRAAMRRIVEAFDAPRRATLEAALTPAATRVQAAEAPVIGKGTLTSKEAKKAAPAKGNTSKSGAGK